MTRREPLPIDPLEGAEPAPAPPPPTSAEGVDLTQIRALKRLTPAERLAALTAAANNLLRLRKNARRL
jgi:hypothetical protein